MLLARQTRRSALRGESMFDRAGIIGGGQFARTYFRMAGGQLFRILGKNPSGRRAASSRYSQPFAIRVQNEPGTTYLRSGRAAAGIRLQNTLAARYIRHSGSRMVRRFLGDFHGRCRVRQIRDHEQRRRRRGAKRAASALLQQQRTTRLQRRISRSCLALPEEIRTGGQGVLSLDR